ncbi:hypothetical protein BBP40_004494 [Aspergillus hancockii]|nr:hypothetical protein BBP40_004494 [Aspergillus hancockii]
MKPDTTLVTLSETSLLGSVALSSSNPPAISTASPTSGHHGGGFSTKTKIAVAIPISVVGFVIIAGLLLFLLNQHRRREQHDDPMIPVVASPSYPPTVPKLDPNGEFGPTPTQTTRASLATTQTETLPEPQVRDPNHPLESPRLPERNGFQPRYTEQVHSVHSTHISITNPTYLTAANMDLHDQRSPRPPVWTLSPFEDSPDDAASEVSTMTDMGGETLSQPRDMDDVSSISSIDESDRRRHGRS